MIILICQQRRPSSLLHQCPGHILSTTKSHLQGKLSIFDAELARLLKLQQFISAESRHPFLWAWKSPFHKPRQPKQVFLSLWRFMLFVVMRSGSNREQLIFLQSLLAPPFLPRITCHAPSWLFPPLSAAHQDKELPRLSLFSDICF